MYNGKHLVSNFDSLLETGCVDWDKFYENNILDELFIGIYMDRLPMDIICEHQKLSENFLITNFGKFKDWKLIIRTQELSESLIETFIEEICEDYGIDKVKCAQELQALQSYLDGVITMPLITAVSELETRVSKMVYIDDEEEFVCESNKMFAYFLNKIKKVEFLDDIHETIIVEKDEMESLCGSSSGFYKMLNEYVIKMVSIYDRLTNEICLFNDKETWEKYQDENPNVLMFEKRAERPHEITDELRKIIGSMGKCGLNPPSFIVLEGYDLIINSEEGCKYLDLIGKTLDLPVICIRNNESYKVRNKEMFDINSMNDMKVGDAITFEDKEENN